MSHDLTQPARHASRNSCRRRGVSAALFAVFASLGHLSADGLPAGAQEPDALSAAMTVQRAFTDVIARTENSVVSIARIRRPRQSPPRDSFNPFGIDLGNTRSGREAGPGGADFIPNDFGTGIIIAPEANPSQRLILTNYHVVRGGPPAGEDPATGEDWLYVQFAVGRGASARILAADPRSDLAVLAIDHAESGIDADKLTPIRLAGGEQTFRKGQLVLALGNPYAIARDGSPSVSWGMISNIQRRPAVSGLFEDPETLKQQTIHHLGTLLHVDTRLQLGTSGGALVNLKGELIGVTTSLAAMEGYESSAGYAIPIDAAMKRIIDSLCRGHEVEYGFLGIRPGTISARDVGQFAPVFGQPSAAKAEHVIPNSPAADASLQNADVILAVNSHPVYDKYDLMRRIGLLGPGTTARLRIWRPTKQRKLTVDVELGKWPAMDDDGIIATNPRQPDWRGLSVDFPTARSKFLSNTFQYHHAVVVTRVAEGSPADVAGLREGDFITHVNNVPVRMPEQFQRAVRGLDDPVTLVLVDDRRVTIAK